MFRRITAALTVVACAGVGAGAVAANAAADRTSQLFDVHSLAIAPDGAHVYAGQGLGAPYVVLSRDPSTSRLSYKTKSTFPEDSFGGGGDFRRTIVVSPDSKDVYDSLNDANAVRHMRAVDGSVLFGGRYVNYAAGIAGMTGPAQIAISPDGQCVYVTAIRGYPMSIVAFRRDRDSGALAFVDTYTAGADDHAYWAEMAFSADGRRLYAAAGLRGIGSFTRDEATCAVDLASITALSGQQVTGIAMAPDGRTLYSVGAFTSQLTASEVDPATGALSPVQTLTGGRGGTHGLDGVSGVVVSPDGTHVYTSAGVENAIAAFERSADGRLVPRDVWRNGEHGIVGLAPATSLVISADGRSVYASSAGIAGAVVAFARDATTGALSYVGSTTEADGLTNVPPPGVPGPGVPGPGVPGPGAPGPWGPGPGTPGGPAVPPSDDGHVGVSINAGARYTNKPVVRVSVVWPAGASRLLVANDGGFGRSGTFSRRGTVTWRLDSSGPERLPKTIYARFDGGTQTFQDDIILDETAPRVTSATVAASASQATSRAAGKKKRTSKRRTKAYRITVRAQDRTSGVSQVQVAANKRKPGRLVKHRSRLTVKVAGQAPRFVRARDRAGNFSKWHRLKAAKRAKRS
jgi:6-phosphogluconolactonase (cycloisomerase 2 family)